MLRTVLSVLFTNLVAVAASAQASAPVVLDQPVETAVTGDKIQRQQLISRYSTQLGESFKNFDSINFDIWGKGLIGKQVPVAWAAFCEAGSNLGGLVIFDASGGLLEVNSEMSCVRSVEADDVNGDGLGELLVVSYETGDGFSAEQLIVNFYDDNLQHTAQRFTRSHDSQWVSLVNPDDPDELIPLMVTVRGKLRFLDVDGDGFKETLHRILTVYVDSEAEVTDWSAWKQQQMEDALGSKARFRVPFEEVQQYHWNEQTFTYK